MAEAPKTSITLLKAIANNAESVRWAEFCRAYDAPMRAFLAARYPDVEPDDAIQDTLITLLRVLPGYTYLPDERGHFRNYLLGILKYRALDILRRRKRDARLYEGLRDEDVGNLAAPEPEVDEEEAAWKQSAYESALAQLVALRHEPPEAVAAAFGTTRNNVDQIKNRMVAKLHELVVALVQARDGGRP